MIVRISPVPMNAFQMLLILGFPPSVAAASVAPEIFCTEATDTITPAESSTNN